MEAQGVKDEDEIAYIDCSTPRKAEYRKHEYTFRDGVRCEPWSQMEWAVW